jgi:lysophospholipase L1-like esterase
MTKFSFPDARKRHLRYQFSGPTRIAGIRLENTNLLSAAPLPKAPRAVVFGDSFAEGTGAAVAYGASTAGGFATSLAEKMGWDLVLSGSGGTGYRNPGPVGRFKYIDRALPDICQQNADAVVIFGTVNDGGQTTEAEAGALFDLIATNSPATKIIVVGPLWKETPVQHTFPGATNIKGACLARGIKFINPVIPSKEWYNSANKATYFGGLNATATASVSGGAVQNVTLTSGGVGFMPYNTPSVTFSGGGASTQATGIATVDGRVTALNVIAGGAGYTIPPLITISGGGGTGATAAATVAGGEVVAVTITSQGTGYISTPKVSLSHAEGSGGAIITAGVSGPVINLAITTQGSGYTTAPTVTIEAPGDNAHPNQAGHDYLAERIVWEIQQ